MREKQRAVVSLCCCCCCLLLGINGWYKEWLLTRAYYAMRGEATLTCGDIDWQGLFRYGLVVQYCLGKRREGE